MSHDSHHHPVKLPSLFHASPSKHSSVLDSPTRTRRAASGKSRALPESDTPVASHVVLPDIVSVKVTRHGGSTATGDKDENQDEYNIVDIGVEEGLFVGVYDGHGPYGRHFATYVKGQFLRVLKTQSTFLTALQEAFAPTFAQLQENLKKYNTSTFSGTTATVAIVRKGILYVAHTGDSRAILGIQQDGKERDIVPFVLTLDHQADDESEAARCRAAGARLEPLTDRRTGEHIGPMRVWKGSEGYPGQCVTRTLGDTVAHTLGVNCVPDVRIRHLSAADKVMIVATGQK